MPDSLAIDAEHAVQRSFRKNKLLQLLILFGSVFLLGRWMAALPDRRELGPRSSELGFEPVRLDRRGFGPLRLVGAWQLSSSDPRFGGISALALDGRGLLALTDSGAVIRFAKPVASTVGALIQELPDGPGDRRFKSRRDSEALLRDPAGRGWWVAFERRHELWLYDSSFTRAIGRVMPGRRWPRNRGIEALAGGRGTGLLLLPENGDTVVEVRGRSAVTARIDDPRGRISDAARLPTGELLVVNRRLTPLGFRNGIGILERSREGYRYSGGYRLAVSMLDNVEGIAPEQLPGGAVRLWLMTDDNFQRPLRTLLIALDMPPARRRN